MSGLLKKGEKGDGIKTTSIVGNTVYCRALSVNDTMPDDVKGYITETTFDFSDVPLSKVYQAAAEFALIRWRVQFRKNANPELVQDLKLPAIEFLPKTKLSPKEKVLAKVKQMTAEEKAELLAALTA